MGDTADTSNVHAFPGTTPEPQPRSGRRGKDRRAAARQAKKRSKNNRDRDASVAKDALVYAPPIAPTVTQAARNGAMPSRETLTGWRTMALLARDLDARASGQRHGRGIRFAALTAALALATVSGGFSITGMTSIFVGAYWPVVGMGVALEVGKLSAVAALPTLYPF